MKTNVYFFIEKSEVGLYEKNTLAVFQREPGDGDYMFECYSLKEGHSTCSLSYLRTLRLASVEEAADLIDTMRETYGYDVNNLNPF